MKGIVLANGVVIDPITKKPTGQVSKATKVEKEMHRQGYAVPPAPAKLPPIINNTNFRSRIVDLPAEPKQLNPLLLVLGYFVLGLADRDIAAVTGFTEKQIGSLRATDLFDEVRSKIVKNLKLNTKEHIGAELENAGLQAAQNVVKLMTSTDQKVQLAASKDILDRVGFRPIDVHEHKHSFEDEIRIRVIHDDAETKQIDLPAMEIDDA